MHADLNGDGHKEVLLTHEGMRMGRGGCSWVVYVKEGDGYRRANFLDPENFFGFGLIASTEDALVTRAPDGSERIQTYWPQGSRQADIVVYSMNKTGEFVESHELVPIDPNDPFNAVKKHYSVAVIDKAHEIDLLYKEQVSLKGNAVANSQPTTEEPTESLLEDLEKLGGGAAKSITTSEPQETTFLAPGAAAIVSDPIQDFVSNPPVYDIQPVVLSESYQMHADLNGDGRKEMLLTHEGMRMGRGGCDWVVYLNELSGYRRLNFSVPDNLNGFPLIASTEDSIVFPGPDGAERIRTYWPQGSGKAELVTYYMDKEGRLRSLGEDLTYGPEDPFSAVKAHYSVPVIAGVLALDLSNLVLEADGEKESSQVSVMGSIQPVTEQSTDSQTESMRELEGATASAGDPAALQLPTSEAASEQSTPRPYAILLVAIMLVTGGLGVFVGYRKRIGGGDAN